MVANSYNSYLKCAEIADYLLNQTLYITIGGVTKTATLVENAATQEIYTVEDVTIAGNIAFVRISVALAALCDLSLIHKMPINSVSLRSTPLSVGRVSFAFSIKSLCSLSIMSVATSS